MFDINALLPVFDPASVTFPTTFRLVSTGRGTPGRPVFRVDGFWGRDAFLPWSMTKHRQQYQKVGKNLFKVVVKAEHKPKDRVPASELAILKAKLEKPHLVTYGDLKPASDRQLVRASEAEVAEYNAAREALDAYCRKLYVEHARRRHSYSNEKLVKALQVVQKAGLVVSKPSLPVGLAA